MADLVRLKQFVGAARRGTDFCVHCWRAVSLFGRSPHGEARLEELARGDIVQAKSVRH